MTIKKQLRTIVGQLELVQSTTTAASPALEREEEKAAAHIQFAAFYLQEERPRSEGAQQQTATNGGDKVTATTNSVGAPGASDRA